MEASVIVMKCTQTKHLFGVRIQKMEDGDWYRTWAFKLNETRAAREGYNKNKISGGLSELEGFPGCPYCGRKNFYICGYCKQVACTDYGAEKEVCPSCGESLSLTVADRFDVGTGTF